MKIAFVGGGHMTAAIIAGMRAANRTEEIAVADRNAEKRRALQNNFSVNAVAAPAELPDDADILILSVKPADIRAACQTIAPQNAIVVSVAAGISLSAVAQSLPFSPRYLIRAMPNTPLAVCAGMTVCYTAAADTIREKINPLFSAAGEVLWVQNESMLQAATAISGCGPAYLYYLAEAMEAEAHSAGFSPAQARILVSQTLRGGGKMLCLQQESPARLRRAVAVKGGATEQAILKMESQKYPQIVRAAMRAADNRVKEIAAQLNTPEK